MFFLEDLPDQATLDSFAKRFSDMEADTTAACLRLLKVASHLLRDLDTHFTGHGLSTARFLVLVVLDRTPAKHLMPAEIARQLGISKKNTARLLDLMVADGLVTRTPHATDRRALLIEPTARGRALLDDSLPGYYRTQNRALSGINPEGKQELIALFDLLLPSA